MATSDGTHRIAGTALVLLQFLLIIALAMLATPAFLRLDAPAAAWALAAGGVLVGLWALSCNRPGNFNIRPDPRPGGHLVDRGPYQWIRHPMYTAVIACGIACAVAIGTTWGWLGAGALVLVLVVKATIEERAMVIAHPDYQAYRLRTTRFVPWLI